MIDTFLGIRPAASSGWVSKDPLDPYWYGPRGVDTVAGVPIDEDTAMSNITTVFACVAKVSKTTACLPLTVVEKTGPNTREPVDHWLLGLLDDSPNEESGGLTLRETLQANLELWGNAYVGIDWKGTQQREAGRLTVLPSREVVVKRDEDGKLFYVWRPRGGGRDIITADRMWHVPGLSFNGITGVSVIGYNREALGLSMAATQFGSAFFGNGAWAGGFFERPIDAPELSEEGAERFLASINEKFRGAKNAFGFGMLRESTTFKQIDIPIKDAMLLSMRKFQRVELCGIFDVPLIMIQDDEHSTMRNSEQADNVFAKHSILPRCVRIEKSARRRFFPGTKMHLKHNLAGLVRGDFKARMEGYGIGRNWGLYSGNDCRAMEDLNPIPGNDEYLSPLNMVPIGSPRPIPVGATDSEGNSFSFSSFHQQDDALRLQLGQRDSTATQTLQPAIEHVAREVVDRQCLAASKAWLRHGRGGSVDDFKQWAEQFFEKHANVMQAKLEPLIRGWEDATSQRSGTSAHNLAEQYCDECFDTLMVATDHPPGVPEVIARWKEQLAGGIVSRLSGILNEKE